MKKMLDLHDRQILKIISNPIIGCIQLLISQGSEKVLEIDVTGIRKIAQENIDCLSLFFDSGGGLDSGYIEKDNDSQKLYLSGIIDWNQGKHTNVNWSFLIEADKIELMCFQKSEEEVNKLMDQEKINFYDFDKKLSFDNI